MRIEDVASDPGVARARRILRETDAETLADMVDLVEIPAPPFGEQPRGARVAERFREIGLADVAIDEVGNVLGRLPDADGPHGDSGPDGDQNRGAGAGGRAADPIRHDGAGVHDGDRSPVLLTAHLDTVFPEETDVTVRRDGDRLLAPGVADDVRGLAAMLAIARALVRARVSTRRPLAFVATVGEEGAGDLRGAKHLFREGSSWREAAGFITLEGTGRRRIVHRALGARRLRVTLRGPGGHSWVDWGTANPIGGLGFALAELGRLPLPPVPHTTLNAGRIGGGSSINVIPSAAWVELDLRSESADALAELEARVGRVFVAGVEEVNGRRRAGTPGLRLEVELIGDRPTGKTPRRSALLQIARAATRFIGQSPQLVVSSTDANVPMALGIPAIALGAGGHSGSTHTTEEWYSNEGGPEGIERALLVAVAVAGPERSDS